MQKFIWDLDETLLSADFRKEDDFLKNKYLMKKSMNLLKIKLNI